MALAVSGGSDSTALLRLAGQWALERGGKPKLSVLTVDHGLRQHAAAEAAQVAAWASELGLEHHTLTWAGPKPASGIQAKARAARYDLMADWCRSHGATALLTAHTLDDQAETVLMRLTRTASLDSLAGIPPVGQWNGIVLLRPLLEQSRNQLRGFLEMHRHDWIEDPSNMDERFERVRIRKLLAGLQSSGISERRLADLAAECRDAAAVLSGAAQAFVTAHLAIHPEGYGTFPAIAFLALPAAIRMRVLRRVIPLMGGGPMPERAELARMASALETPGTRRSLGGAVVWSRKMDILVAREAGRIAEAPVTVPASGSVLWDGRFQVTAPPGSTVLPARLFPGLPGAEGIPHLVKQAAPALQLADGTAVGLSFGSAGPFCAKFRRHLPP